MVTRAQDNKYIQKTSPPEPLVQIQNYFTEMFLIKPSSKIGQIAPQLNKMAARAKIKKKSLNPLAPLAQIQNTSTEILLNISLLAELHFCNIRLVFTEHQLSRARTQMNDPGPRGPLVCSLCIKRRALNSKR